MYYFRSSEQVANANMSEHDFQLIFLGHSGFQVQSGAARLVIDPFVQGNPLAAHLDLNDIDCDHIFISHGHQDHLADAEELVNRTDAKIVSNFEIVSWYGEKGIKGHPLSFGGTYSSDFGRVKYVPAWHSSMLPDGKNGGNPGGFVFMLEGIQFYFAGDTCVYSDMKLIPQLCGSMDFAILPIGGNFTMDAQEAILAAQFVGVSTVVGCHYDTFDMIKIDHAKTMRLFADAGITLILPEIGKVIDI